MIRGKIIILVSIFAIIGWLSGWICRGIFFEEKSALAEISEPLQAEPPAGQGEAELCGLDSVDCPDELPIEELVKREIAAQSINYGVNTYLATEIARCESQFNPLAKNPHSTAKGVYQFINRTWADHCSGDVRNYKANVECFMRWFPKYPSWWSECLNKIKPGEKLK